MIHLQVAEYCQKCPHFEAETEEIISPVSACFIITCANSEKCRALLQYIKGAREQEISASEQK